MPSNVTTAQLHIDEESTFAKILFSLTYRRIYYFRAVFPYPGPALLYRSLLLARPAEKKAVPSIPVVVVVHHWSNVAMVTYITPVY